MTNSIPHIIKGDIFNDSRGKLLSCNLFDMSRVKRMYSIENINSNYIREVGKVIKSKLDGFLQLKAVL